MGSNPTPDTLKTFDSKEGTAVLAQLVERQTFNLVVQGSSPWYSILGGFTFLHWFRDVMVSIPDFESGHPGSNPGETFKT